MDGTPTFNPRSPSDLRRVPISAAKADETSPTRAVAINDARHKSRHRITVFSFDSIFIRDVFLLGFPFWAFQHGSVYTQPPFFDPARYNSSPGSHLCLRQAPLSSCRKTPKTGKCHHSSKFRAHALRPSPPSPEISIETASV